MKTFQQLMTWYAVLILCVGLCSPAFPAEQEAQGEAIAHVKLEISVRYAEGAPGPQTVRWWSAVDSTFVYWFQNQTHDYQLAAYETALPYAKPQHQWQGLENWSQYASNKPSTYRPGAPISRVKISVWDAEGNEHLLITNDGGWATMCGKLGEAYDIGVHSHEIQLAGRNAVIAGIAFEDLVLTERGLTVEILVPADASAPAVRVQDGAGLCCRTGTGGQGQPQQPDPPQPHVQMTAASSSNTTTNDAEGLFKLSIRLVHEEGTTGPGVTATTWWSNFAPSFLYWFGDRQPDYRFAAFDASYPYLKSDHRWQMINQMNGNSDSPPARQPGAPIPKVEVSVWDSDGREHVLATDANGWATFCGKAWEKYDIGLNSSEVESAAQRQVIAGVALEDVELQEGGTIIEAIFAPNAVAPTLRVTQGGGICCAAGAMPGAGGTSLGLIGSAIGVTAGGPPLGLCLAGQLGCGGDSDPEVMSGVQ